MGEMIEVCRSSVQTWECDVMGHMNVQFYVAHATSGIASLGNAVGLGPSKLRDQGLRLRAISHHIRFLRELRPGAPFYVRGGFSEATSDKLRFVLEIRNTATNDIMATLTGNAVLSNPAGTALTAFPEDVLSRVTDYTVETPKQAQPRGLSLETEPERLRLQDDKSQKLIPIYQAMVKDADCDADGYMMNRLYIGHISDGIPNMLAATRGEDRSDMGNIGGAALEYRTYYHKRPQAGDILCVRSGLISISEKAYTWGHWMFDAESGESVATAEAVAISLDLVARKAVPIPDDFRAILEKMKIA